MDLNLTPSEQRKLIELVYLGEWMINAHHDPDFQDDEATLILQRLLATGSIDDTGQDEETNAFYMNTEWTDRLYDTYIYDYDDHTFWDELTERLAQRDLARSRGVDPSTIVRDDDLLELHPLEDKYRDELEGHGIDRLDIVEEY